MPHRGQGKPTALIAGSPAIDVVTNGTRRRQGINAAREDHRTAMVMGALPATSGPSSEVRRTFGNLRRE